MSLVRAFPTTRFGTRFAWVRRPSKQFAGKYSHPTVKGEELGNGRARKKGKAMDEAAQMALEALSYPSPRVSKLIHRRRNSFP